MRTLLLLVVCAYLSFVSAQQLCTGNPPTYNGLPCATTTNYNDGTAGACGCGNNYGPDGWENTLYTAAASPVLFDTGGATWCGAGCGSCYRLTPTGGYVSQQGTAPPSTASVVFMITNLCPTSNTQWCPAPGTDNQYGYPVHFDLRNAANQIQQIGWNNPEVTYEQVACSNNYYNTPTCYNWAGCQCYNDQPGTQGNCGEGGDGGSTTGISVTSGVVTGGDGTGGDGGGGPTPSSFQWANGVNGWWVAFGLQASSVTINCGQGPVSIGNAGWAINGDPVWVWQGYPYQCAQTVTITYDGGTFSATRP